MLPATTIVAPNSPSARANASTAPASTDGQASGRLIVRKTLSGRAPSVAATSSYRACTCSKPARAVRTSSGSPMIAIASTTAFLVKTISIPSRSSHPPITPRRLRRTSRISPVATGGMTSGSETSVSTSDRPGNRRRASSHARPTPIGSTISVEAVAHNMVNHVICHTFMLALVRSSGIGYQVSGIGIGYRVSVSGIGYRVSGIGYRYGVNPKRSKTRAASAPRR
jgi:hypothetical protein